MNSGSGAARDILASFIADAGNGRRSEDGALEAILLEHLLLQGGFKLVEREPDQRMLLAGLPGGTPDDIWRAMWDAAGSYDPDMPEDYTPA